VHNNGSVSLYDRFELLGLYRDDGVKTFEAREIATGRPVKVHLFVQAGAPLQAALLKAVEHLPDEERQRIIDRGKHEGTPYLVTDRLADYPGLSEWVQAASRQAKPKKAALETAGAWKLPQTPAPAVSPSALNQQFAELFTTAERPVLPADTPAPPPVPPASAPPAKQPGEFTRMFQAPAVPSRDVPKADVPKPDVPKPDVPKPNAPPPGEFTRMFQAPAAAPGPLPAPLPTTTGPADFERLFEPSSPAGPMPRSPVVQQPLAPQAPGHSGPNKVGEFTRMFGKVDVPAAPPPPAATPAKEPGEFTRMFQAPPGTTPTPPPTAQQPTPIAQPLPPAPSPSLASPGAFSKPAGPGEYTRQFSAPAQMTLGQTAASPTPMTPSAPPPFGTPPPMSASPAQTAPRKNNLPLIIGIAGIVLLAVLIVVFFAMRPK
jgi:hypothetical protein